jgi:hypothetical protein
VQGADQEFGAQRRLARFIALLGLFELPQPLQH